MKKKIITHRALVLIWALVALVFGISPALWIEALRTKTPTPMRYFEDALGTDWTGIVVSLALLFLAIAVAVAPDWVPQSLIWPERAVTSVCFLFGNILVGLQTLGLVYQFLMFLFIGVPFSEMFFVADVYNLFVGVIALVHLAIVGGICVVIGALGWCCWGEITVEVPVLRSRVPHTDK